MRKLTHGWERENLKEKLNHHWQQQKKQNKTKQKKNTTKINAIRTNYANAKIDKTQHNNRHRLSGDREETINHNKRMQ